MTVPGPFSAGPVADSIGWIGNGRLTGCRHGGSRLRAGFPEINHSRRNDIGGRSCFGPR